MKKHKLAADQTLKEEEDSLVAAFSSSQYERVLEFILSWGFQAEPLAPASLVERWKEINISAIKYQNFGVYIYIYS